MTNNFNDLGLSQEVLKAIEDMGYEEPSPIQRQSIPLVLAGRDMIGQAQTGTGKTASFGIPIIEKMDASDKSIQSIILCPTRELSIQVADEITSLAKYKGGIKVLAVYGGQPIVRQISALKKGVQIVVGTPGRVIDHLNRRTMKVDSVKLFVLDEADEMFAMGFREDIEKVLEYIPEERQSIFFSATMAKDIMNFAKRFQKDPEVIKIVKKEMTVPKVDQYYFDLDENEKTEILTRIMDIENPVLTIVFCNTKRKVDELTGKLQARSYSADALHGDLTQGQRDHVMNKFRDQKIDVLVATDVAARGIDVDEVDMVVNFDLPQDDEYYVHRIGRTARAGRHGSAISFVSGKDFHKLKEIERYIKTEIPKKKIPTLKDVKESELSKIIEVIKENVGKDIDSRIINSYDALIDFGLTSVEIAQIAMTLFAKKTSLGEHEELDYIDNDKVRRPRNNRREEGRSRSKGGSRSKFNKNAKRVFLSVGRLDGVSERHILGSVLENDRISKGDIGKIDIYDKFSFFDVNPAKIKEVVSSLNNSQIRNISIRAEEAKSKGKK